MPAIHIHRNKREIMTIVMKQSADGGADEEFDCYDRQVELGLKYATKGQCRWLAPNDISLTVEDWARVGGVDVANPMQVI